MDEEEEQVIVQNRQEDGKSEYKLAYEEDMPAFKRFDSLSKEKIAPGDKRDNKRSITVLKLDNEPSGVQEEIKIDD